MRLLTYIISTLLWPLLAAALLTVSYASASTNSINGIRVWPAPENTRIVFDLKSKPDYKYFTLSKPDRLVIDFKDTNNTADLALLANNDPRIKLIRTSTTKSKSDTRLVLELAKAYPITVFPLAPAGQYSDRLVIDLYDKEKKDDNILKTLPNEKRDIIIAIVLGAWR
ncbi:AMIN domain-containing protein [Colwellia maritima]|uniref:AMIN domain-containing protein n=1 Tax=Colwellia maritima TaxID=2912588 RepID=UPI0030846101